MSLLNIILCIFLPPVAVFMKHGAGKALIINIILCLLGWIPGMIHAFFVTSE
ncbi:YqaE/Pmp3 family membrane protein [Membranihabitans maritimus]|uniref:YqaE/Pmp3 family membrane protein n=1 Tax=Membranihabitans maritimus TaxID=2904244 RepID=UPI0021038D66|nr:YqaE/Pmp3 family membrane protein [Membranihabitans maritimus]